MGDGWEVGGQKDRTHTRARTMHGRLLAVVREQVLVHDSEGCAPYVHTGTLINAYR